MARPSITNIQTTNTFEVWFNKTNELVDLMQENVLTASANGDITVGDAELQGTFTASNISVSNTITVDTLDVTNITDNLSLGSPATLSDHVVRADRSVSANTGLIGGGNLTADLTFSLRDITSGNSDIGALRYNGVTKVAGKLYGGTSDPSANIRLNYDGDFYVNNFSAIGDISGDSLDITGAAVLGSVGTGTLTANNATITSLDVGTITSSGGTLDTLNVTSFTANTATIFSVETDLIIAPSGTLEITANTVNTSGDLNTGFINSGEIVAEGDITANGDITATGDFNSFSDISLKENITPLVNPLEKTLALNGVYYNFKFKPDGTKVGLIAQEVEKILPEVVSIDNKSGLKTVAYQNIVPLLIEAIKELKSELDDLNSRL